MNSAGLRIIMQWKSFHFFSTKQDKTHVREPGTPHVLIQVSIDIQFYLMLPSFQSSETVQTTIRQHRWHRAIVCEGLAQGPFTVTALGDARTCALQVTG